MPIYQDTNPVSQIDAQKWLADFTAWATDTDRRLKAVKALALNQ